MTFVLKHVYAARAHIPARVHTVGVPNTGVFVFQHRFNFPDLPFTADPHWPEILQQEINLCQGVCRTIKQRLKLT